MRVLLAALLGLCAAPLAAAQTIDRCPIRPGTQCGIHIPVGLPINSVTPEEIAISIMAQVIQKRRENAASGVSRSSCRRLGEEDGTAKTTSSSR